MYYFILASLPQVCLGQEPEVRFSEFMELCQENLPRKDLEQLDRLRRLIDLDNVRSVIMEEPINPMGTMNQKEIEEAIANRVGLPDYVFDILGDQPKERFSEVFLTFFRTEAHEEGGYLKRYFEFERALQLCLCAYRSEKLGRDLKDELKGADTSNLMVRALPEFPYELLDLYDVLNQAGDDPWEQYVALAKYRFERVENMVQTGPFSLERLMAYMLQLGLAEEWYRLEVKEGI